MQNFIYTIANHSDCKQLQQLGLISYGQFEDVLGYENWKIMEANHNEDSTYLKLLDIAKCFVCKYENEIIGMAFLIPHGNPTTIFKEEWCYIRLVGVHLNFEGKGIGK